MLTKSKILSNTGFDVSNSKVLASKTCQMPVGNIVNTNIHIRPIERSDVKMSGTLPQTREVKPEDIYNVVGSESVRRSLERSENDMEGITVIYPNTEDQPKEDVIQTPEKIEATEGRLSAAKSKYDEATFLKKIIRIYLSNLGRFDGKLILKNEDLIDIIQYLTSADSVVIKVDFDINCCGASKGLNYIDKILITKDGKSVDMKYIYNEEYNTLLGYGINLEFSRD